MRILRTLRFILEHPLNRGRPYSTLLRFAMWQIRSRLASTVDFPWIESAVLRVRSGMTGATGNIYCGLHEFSEMAFLLHLLRPGDLFIDVGANVGSYTILASKLCDARTIAFEPDPTSAAALLRNVSLNELGGIVEIRQAAVGDYDGDAIMTSGLDTTNRIATKSDKNVQNCKMMRLDNLPLDCRPVLIKLDVEGYEAQVVAGGKRVFESDSLKAILTEFEDKEIRNYLISIGFSEAFYNPFSRKLSVSSFGFQVANTLFVKRSIELENRLSSAPTRLVNGHRI